MDLAYIKQNWKNEMNVSLSESIRAWDSVAEDYIYDQTISFEKNEFLRYLQKKIVFTEDMEILDVGCGAGAYSLAIADKVRRVVGVDFSPKMIELARDSAAERSILNSEFLERDWYACSTEEFRGKFDLVFAHTTPAIADYTSFIKMLEASRKYCVLCKPVRRTDAVFDQLRKLAGQETSNNDDSAAYIFDTIWGYGFNPEVSYQKTVWRSKKTIQEAREWYLGRLKGACVLDEKTEEMINRYLEEISVEGIITETTHTTLITFFWEVD